MIEEIKEILDYIDDRIIPNEKWDKIKDYITNLQQLYENGLKVNQNSHKYITELEMNNAILKEELKNRPIVDFTFDVYKELEDYKSRCENTDKIMYEFEEWLKSNFWNDDEGNESYQIEKYTTFYSVYRKLDLLKTLNKGDENETNS